MSPWPVRWRGALRGRVRGARTACLLVALSAVGALLALPAGAGAALSVTNWEAGTCSNVECTDAGSPSEFYTQAAGHPQYGITDFEFGYTETGLTGAKIPDGRVRDVRVDLPAGLAVNPEATPQCPEKSFEEFNCPKDTQVGEDEAIGTASLLSLLHVETTVTEHFPVYNIVRRSGEPARFGVEIKSTTLEALAALGHDLEGHLYLEGGLSWHHEAETSESSGVPTGDYHEFFKIKDIPQEPEVVKSKLIFWGVPQRHNGSGEAEKAFITLPSTCETKPVTYLHVDSYEAPGDFQKYANETPVTATGCESLSFQPSLTTELQETEGSRADTPDGPSFDLHIPQYMDDPSRPDSPDVRTTTVTLPEGMTLNAAAANGLQGCSNAQFQTYGTQPEQLEQPCPSASEIGTATIDAPGIPAGSLTGRLYLGEPEENEGRGHQDPESGGKYRVFLAAYSAAYGVGVRLEGRIGAAQETGRLTATFTNAPQVPFEAFQLHFRTGARAPLANPLACGAATPSSTVVPYGGGSSVAPSIPQPPSPPAIFEAAGGGPCPTPAPFALSQSVAPQSPDQAGEYAPFTLSFTRGDGEQYLSRIETTLPPGLLGAIPSVPLCGEAQANAGTCPPGSQIGQVSATAGAGTEPYAFAGAVYLTGPYGNDPYGLSIVVPALAGPFDLGDVVVRAGIGVGMYTGQATVSGTVPAVWEGVPLRLRSLTVAIDRRDFLFNPTNCSALSVSSVLTSTQGATQTLSGPFQVSGCSNLKFTPRFSMSVAGRTTKAGGAGLEVKIGETHGQADLRQVQVQLPKQLPSRLTTIQKACPAASFEQGPPPGSCPNGSRVGGATVTTPVLAGTLSGPAYLVSHGGEAFPDLDLVLHGDDVTVVLVGHTHISSSGITTSSFETLPDVPITSATVTLPVGPSSVLTALKAGASLCGQRLLAPTTLVAQSGARITDTTTIAVTGCGLQVIAHRVSGTTAMLTVLVPSAGRVTVSGHDVRAVTRGFKAAGTYRLNVRLNAAGAAMVHGHRRLALKLRVGFVASARGHAASAAYVMTKFR